MVEVNLGLVGLSHLRVEPRATSSDRPTSILHILVLYGVHFKSHEQLYVLLSFVSP